MTACVLLHRDGQWLLSVRSSTAAYAPGRIGLLGGHLDPDDFGPGALEAAARRELAEEAGIDLGGTPLRYLESELFDADGDQQLTVTFVAPAPPGVEPRVGAPAELSAVGWWDAADLTGDPRCPAWLPALLQRATRAL